MRPQSEDPGTEQTPREYYLFPMSVSFPLALPVSVSEVDCGPAFPADLNLPQTWFLSQC